MNLTGHQVRQLVEFMGGDYGMDVTIEYLPERTLDGGTGTGPEILPAGLYAWMTDDPEEGVYLLDEEPENESIDGG